MKPAPLTAFLMTEKGHHFLASVAPRYSHLFALVVIGDDATLVNDFSADIAALCNQHGIACVPRKQFVGPVPSEYALAISWRWLITHPEDRLIVFHDSLLPAYRGFAPLVNGLIRGETRFGVTAIFGASEYDKGDILFQSSTQVTYPITIAQLIAKVADNYVDAGLQVLSRLDAGEALVGKPQNHSAASYSVWRDDDDYRLDWRLPASTLRRTVDALGTPYKGASAMVDGTLARVLEVEEWPVPLEVAIRDVGKVLFMDGGKPVVICGEGLLKIVKLVHAETGASMLPLKKFRTRFA